MTHKIRRFGVVAGVALFFGATADAVPVAGTSISAAVANPGRPDADRAKDALRHPAELLAFLHIQPGNTVADIWPGDYWDRLFSDVVGQSGRVFAVHLVEGDTDDKIATPPAGSTVLEGHKNVVTVVSHVNTLRLPAKADLIWIRNNYHDLYDPFMGPADIAAFNRAVFQALKPGGRFVVIDHVAPAGTKTEATNTTHRIDPEVVKSDMAAAGFRFVGASDLLRNPADPHTTRVFDSAVSGHTDQFFFVFQRPK
ncbi:methyltransferase [Polymorphobacter sp. PAMC 29334]|uniref:class I SAM-dependent methyltransferase n=1 Tax=Polymorphobacter sp. PAMC 29334 TaxID=2862331 RepID=UPI001C75C651|nr:methyltransferase [Polymorphobacter sp. PAMC 29334]QYE35975.1 methyltransferase [Polymorphobacter sp. PAMC 29334]